MIKLLLVVLVHHVFDQIDIIHLLDVVMLYHDIG